VEEIRLSWLGIIVAGVAFTAIQGLVVLCLWRWSHRRLTAAPKPRPVPVPETPHITTLLGHEIDDLKERVGTLQTEVQRLKRVKPPVSPYNQAIQMVKQGCEAGEVALGCGISRGEAELFIALYRRTKIKGSD